MRILILFNRKMLNTILNTKIYVKKLKRLLFEKKKKIEFIEDYIK